MMMSHDHSIRDMSRVTGSMLLLVALAGMVYGLRASTAYLHYHSAKYGVDSKQPVEDVLASCDVAHRLYPHNYYVCVLAALRAWHDRYDASGRESRTRLRAAREWCDRGLALNLYNSQLRELKADLMALESPARAAAYWADFVEWQFWEPYNHAVLVRLYVQAGDFPRAVQALQWVKGSAHYAGAKRRLEEAWARATAPPPVRLPLRKVP